DFLRAGELVAAVDDDDVLATPQAGIDQRGRRSARQDDGGVGAVVQRLAERRLDAAAVAGRVDDHCHAVDRLQPARDRIEDPAMVRGVEFSAYDADDTARFLDQTARKVVDVVAERLRRRQDLCACRGGYARTGRKGARDSRAGDTRE